MITDKQIQEAANNYFLQNTGKQLVPIESYKAFQEGVKWALAQDQWIPVSERLPEKQGHYFVKVLNSFPKNCDVIVCEFYEDNKTFYGESCDSPIHDALAWMEIPKTTQP